MTQTSRTTSYPQAAPMQPSLTLVSRAFAAPVTDARVIALEQQVKALQGLLHEANNRLAYHRERMNRETLIHEFDGKTLKNETYPDPLIGLRGSPVPRRTRSADHRQPTQQTTHPATLLAGVEAGNQDCEV